MGFRSASAALALLGLGACTLQVVEPAAPASPFIQQLPEGVLELAASYQNLDAVLIRPEDGCYWYEYRGPVETTLLPLRSKSGRPICTRPPEEATPVADATPQRTPQTAPQSTPQTAPQSARQPAG